MSKQYFIHLHNCKFEVSQEDYIKFYKEKRREKYLYEADEAHGLVSYQANDGGEFSGEDYLVDTEQESIEDIVVKKVMTEHLRRAMQKLTEDERFLVLSLFSDEHNEVTMAELLGVNQSTISRRKDKIIAKLQKIIKN